MGHSGCIQDTISLRSEDIHSSSQKIRWQEIDGLEKQRSHSTDGRVDIHELAIEFCLANKDLYVSPFLPTYEQELEFIKIQEAAIKNGEIFENFILERVTGRLIGCVGLNTPEQDRMNI